MKKVKLTELAAPRMSISETKKMLEGAGNCCCGCVYRNEGGSSIAANRSANNTHDLVSRDSFWYGTGGRS